MCKRKTKGVDEIKKKKTIVCIGTKRKNGEHKLLFSVMGFPRGLCCVWLVDAAKGYRMYWIQIRTDKCLYYQDEQKTTDGNKILLVNQKVNNQFLSNFISFSSFCVPIVFAFLCTCVANRETSNHQLALIKSNWVFMIQAVMFSKHFVFVA